MTNSIRKINKIAMLVGSITLIVLALLIKGVVPSPVSLLHQWCALEHLPPLWLLHLLWLAAYTLIGGSWLGVLCMDPCGTEGELLRYKGGMFLVLTAFFSFVWYLLLFGMQTMLLSWFSLGAAIVSAILAAVCYLRLHAMAGWCILLTALWWVYLFFAQLVVMLHI